MLLEYMRIIKLKDLLFLAYLIKDSWENAIKADNLSWPYHVSDLADGIQQHKSTV